jgi:16S rRNA (guanine527-N7)-methyltransferase
VDTARIAELLTPFLGSASGSRVTLSDEQLRQVSAYLDLLLRWNEKVGLTSVRGPENIVTRHFGESFFAAIRLLDPESQAAIVDVGSGAGFPGLPLKIYAPDVAPTLVESNRRKASFLKEAIRTMNLTGATVFAGRAEECQVTGDLVTLRAVERFECILPSAAELVAPGARLALLIGSPRLDQAKTILCEFLWEAPVLIPESSQRVILAGTKPGS